MRRLTRPGCHPINGCVLEVVIRGAVTRRGAISGRCWKPPPPLPLMSLGASRAAQPCRHEPTCAYASALHIRSHACIHTYLHNYYSLWFSSPPAVKRRREGQEGSIFESRISDGTEPGRPTGLLARLSELPRQRGHCWDWHTYATTTRAYTHPGGLLCLFPRTRNSVAHKHFLNLGHLASSD